MLGNFRRFFLFEIGIFGRFFLLDPKQKSKNLPKEAQNDQNTIWKASLWDWKLPDGKNALESDCTDKKCCEGRRREHQFSQRMLQNSTRSLRKAKERPETDRNGTKTISDWCWTPSMSFTRSCEQCFSQKRFQTVPGALGKQENTLDAAGGGKNASNRLYSSDKRQKSTKMASE